MSDQLLTLLCPRAYEENLLDALILIDGIPVLTSTPSEFHALRADTLTQAEQVLGFAKAAEVRMLIDGARVPALLESLQKEFAGTGLRYWTTPVLDSGEFK